ncbi:MAG: LamG domain-containing protein, partial [Bacteroidia bacterium]|nr:LamG domain-containing protein [Bacteroidia bacterium]
MLQIKITIILFLFSFVCAFSQTDSTIIFDFNTGEIKEKNNRITPKAIGVSLVKDRFGNEQSAAYLHGNPSSYLNLGTSSLLKPIYGSISIWVNLDRHIYAGKGSEANPIISTKNGIQDDFNYAYNLSYDFKSKRLFAISHKDSTQEINIRSENEFLFNNWYHLVFTFNSSQFAFYINGKLQQTASKQFSLNYLTGDSVIIGNSASKKNDRYSQGTFDDIQFFHHALSPSEVLELYEAPNPNKTKQFIIESTKYIAIVIIFILII